MVMDLGMLEIKKSVSNLAKAILAICDDLKKIDERLENLEKKAKRIDKIEKVVNKGGLSEL